MNKDEEKIMSKWCQYFEGDNILTKLVDGTLEGSVDSKELQNYLDAKIESFKRTLTLNECLILEQIMSKNIYYV